MLTIDGSQGEGGGQILRSALALSMVTGRPFRMESIRAGRSKPGLLRQHLAAVKAATAISTADVEGAQLGSRELAFAPASVQPGEYFFTIGSAGSATLVVQTVLPAPISATAPSILVIEGGTHNPHAPPVDFLQSSFLPLLNRMGPSVVLTLDRPGFYPRGGGLVNVSIEPAATLAPLELLERGPMKRCLAKAVVAGLPVSIAQRELDVVARLLSWRDQWCRHESLPAGFGPGNILTIEIESQHVTEVFTGFGARGVPAETVAGMAVEQAQRYLKVDAPVGEYLADQLLLLLALAGKGGFVTSSLSPHTMTNIEVIQTFLNVRFKVEKIDGDRWLVEV